MASKYQFESLALVRNVRDHTLRYWVCFLGYVLMIASFTLVYLSSYFVREGTLHQRFKQLCILKISTWFKFCITSTVVLTIGKQEE